MVYYFQQLFSSNGNTDYEEVADVMRGRVSDEMNQKLLADFIAEEIRQALFQMHPSKAPGPDGFFPLFYQSIGMWLVLANRLKVILPSLISDSQSAFVSRRMISDNSIVAFELLHFMHKRTQGRQGYMALKLDMTKAYDRVEWNFLESLMLGMGFDRRWVHLTMACLIPWLEMTLVSYSFLFNGNPVGYAEQNGALHSVSLCRGAPTVSHLFVADDSFLFLKASQNDCAQ
ncbi:unnamed protein product, partial [Prunus brigantina]